MKKIYFLFLTLLLLTVKLYAQAPNSLNYQGVARNASGIVLPNQPISLRFTVHQGTAGGAVVYQETQPATTNLLGLFTVAIGSGTVVTGNFATISWGANNEYLQVEMDPAGGTSYLNMGTNQFLSVPYALNSGSSSSGWNFNGNTGITNPASPATYGTSAFGATENWLGTTDANDLTFGTGNIERMRLGGTVATAGFLGIGKSNPSQLLDVAGNVQFSKALMPNGQAGTSGFVLQSAGANTPPTWVNPATAASAWNLTGNGGTSYTTNFIGTTDNNNILFKVNGLVAGRLENRAPGNSFDASGSAAFGYLALQASSGGGVASQNAAFGDQALFRTTTGQSNVGVGTNAAYANQTGSSNTAVGYEALFEGASTNSFSNNTAIGATALNTNTTGSNNTALGSGADVTSGALSNATAIGNGAKVAASNSMQLGNTSVTKLVFASNTGVIDLTNDNYFFGASAPGNGYGPAGNNDAGANEIAIGLGALGSSQTAANGNVAIGDFALSPLTVGYFNTVVGNYAGRYMGPGSGTYTTPYTSLALGNTCIGRSAAYDITTGSLNTALGYFAMGGTTTGNTFATGKSNTAVGYQALDNPGPSSSSTALGSNSLLNNTASVETAVGDSALASNSTGLQNTAVGYQSLAANTTGTGNTAIGYKSNVATAALTNATAIGANATVSASNTVVLGNAANVQFSLALMPNGAAGTAGQILQSNGAGAAPTWVAPATSAGTAGGVNYGTGAGSAYTTVGVSGQVLVSSGAGAPTWQNVTAIGGTGDNWGSQAVVTNSALTGNGISGTPLDIAQQGATSGQVLTWNGTSWAPAAAAASGWNLTGNGGTSYTTNFIGTTDNNNILFKVNGLVAGRLENRAPGNSFDASGSAAFGYLALQASSGGGVASQNAAFGDQALFRTTTGQSNVGVGTNAAYANQTGSSNTAVGYEALFEGASTNSFSNNTAIGATALNTNTTGSNNTALGSGADVTSGALSNATAIGNGAKVAASNSMQLGNTSVTKLVFASNTGVIDLTNDNYFFGASAPGNGYGPAGNNDAGANEIAIGQGALGSSQTAANGNVAIGDFALSPLTVGYFNTVVGNYAGRYMGPGSGTYTTPYTSLALGNTCIGRSAAYDITTGSLNTALGYFAMGGTTTGNTFATGKSNTAVGYQALDNPLTSSSSTSVGSNSLFNNTASEETAVGDSAMAANTTGTQNTALGYQSLLANTTGTGNTAIGFKANVGSPTLTNATVIGANATVSSSNSMVLGGTGAGAVNVGIGTASPNSSLQVVGGVSYPLATTAVNLTLTNAHHTVVITGGTPTITLPAAAGNTGRMYVLVNETASPVNVSSYIDFTGTGNPAVPANASIIVQTDGTNWYQIR